MRMYLGAWKDLAKHYKTVWIKVWEQRHWLAFAERTQNEREFLPAVLELEETPVSPLPRAAMRLMVGFAAIALGWAFLGKLDMVATAEGKIVPSDRTKIIQPMGTAVIKAIYVQDGQRVKANDLLLELDATSAEADEKSTRGDWMTARLAGARAMAFLKAVQNTGRRNLRLLMPETQTLLAGIPNEQIAGEEKILAAQVEEYQTKLAKIDAEIARNEAGIAAGREALSQMQETLPIVRERVQDYKKLFEQDYVSKHEYLDKEKERIGLEHELTSQISKNAGLESALMESRHAKESLMAETRRSARETLNENNQRSLESGQKRIKAAQQVRMTQLRSPVDGRVQQLAVHTIGGVVTSAQPVMAVVPAEDSVEIEASIQNKDIGFIHEGQEAVIKVEAFPYTRYGTVPGKVKTISMDAVADEKKGLIFPARVLMLKNTMQVEEKTIHLSPGMAVSVEIKTGKRRVIGYFLSPLLEHAGESLRER